MKLTIEYSLPDEEEMKLTMNAGKYLIALSNMKTKSSIAAEILSFAR